VYLQKGNRKPGKKNKKSKKASRIDQLPVFPVKAVSSSEMRKRDTARLCQPAAKKQYLDVTVSEHHLPPLVGKPPFQFLYVLVFDLNDFVAHDCNEKGRHFRYKSRHAPVKKTNHS